MHSLTLRSTFFSLFTLCGYTLAAPLDYGVPLSWRKFSNARGTAERISISKSGIDNILQHLGANGEFSDIGFWQSANVWSAIAQHDRLAAIQGQKQNSYRDQVLKNLVQAYDANQWDRYQYNDDAMWWATAGIYAYKAYKDNGVLLRAAAVWDRVSKFQITHDIANAGRISGKSFNFKSTCPSPTGSKQSMAGAVFWRSTADDQAVNSITTGLFMTLSAYLAEITRDSKYKDAAILSANWLKNMQLNSNQLLLDSVNPTDCSRSPDSWMFTYNSGKLIEGLSVLGDVTGDQSWKDTMKATLVAAVKTGPWQGSDGIITEGSSADKNNDGVTFKAAFARALLTAAERSGDDQNLLILVHSYLDVQYNALLDLAAKGNTYSSVWHGPAQGFTTWGQMSALDVLVANIYTNS